MQKWRVRITVEKEIEANTRGQAIIKEIRQSKVRVMGDAITMVETTFDIDKTTGSPNPYMIDASRYKTNYSHCRRP